MVSRGGSPDDDGFFRIFPTWLSLPSPSQTLIDYTRGYRKGKSGSAEKTYLLSESAGSARSGGERGGRRGSDREWARRVRRAGTLRPRPQDPGKPCEFPQGSGEAVLQTGSGWSRKAALPDRRETPGGEGLRGSGRPPFRSGTFPGMRRSAWQEEERSESVDRGRETGDGKGRRGGLRTGRRWRGFPQDRAPVSCRVAP